MMPSPSPRPSSSTKHRSHKHDRPPIQSIGVPCASYWRILPKRKATKTWSFRPMRFKKPPRLCIWCSTHALSLAREASKLFDTSWPWTTLSLGNALARAAREQVSCRMAIRTTIRATLPCQPSPRNRERSTIRAVTGIVPPVEKSGFRGNPRRMGVPGVRVGATCFCWPMGARFMPRNWKRLPRNNISHGQHRLQSFVPFWIDGVLLLRLPTIAAPIPRMICLDRLRLYLGLESTLPPTLGVHSTRHLWEEAPTTEETKPYVGINRSMDRSYFQNQTKTPRYQQSKPL